jgi:chromate reductase, NAD(P)H dehydrogenase (quinone)
MRLESNMSQIKIAVFVGSLRRDSFNRCLARAVEKLAPSELTFTDIRIDDLPLYSQDFDADYPPVCQSAAEKRCRGI